MSCLKFFLCAVLLTASFASAQQLEDPIFGAYYYPQLVHFEPVPVGLYTKCHDLRGRKLWLFAKWSTPTAEYLIVNGYYAPQSGKRAEPMDSGLAIAIENGKCFEEDEQWLMSGELIPTPGEFTGDMLPIFHAESICLNGTCHYNIPKSADKAVLDGLIEDALVRLTKAFGSREAFIAALPTPRLKSEDIGPLPYQHLSEFLKNEKTP